jgi:hypothetical protein
MDAGLSAFNFVQRYLKEIVMPRLAVPFVPGSGKLASTAGLPGDDYKDRLVKYIPAESVALYTFTDKLVVAYYGINDKGEATRIPADFLFHFLPWALFVLALVGTPIYLYRQKLPAQPWKVHAVLSTFAFVFWAYTLDGSLFMVNHLYNVLLAGLAAPIFTFVAGWFDPR